MAESNGMLTPDEAAARARWLEERKSGIGGSDAASAVGCDPYRDQLTLWSEKCGLIEPEDLSANEAVEAGNALERAIGDWYGRKFGRQVSLGTPFQLLRSERHPWMFATLDATQVIDGERAVVQIKNTRFPVDAWEDKLPIGYEIQLAHEMIVAGVTRGTLVALHGGQNLRAYDRELHPEFAETLVDAERRFWEQVERGTPPAPGPMSADTLKGMFPRNEVEEVIALPAESDDLDEELERLKAQLKLIEDRKSVIESTFKMWIGIRSGGVTPQGTKFSWKGSEVQYKPQEARTTYVRRFTRSKAK
jgi:putative phage-type endonuclease